jgi:hypothetical protein
MGRAYREHQDDEQHDNAEEDAWIVQKRRARAALAGNIRRVVRSKRLRRGAQ